LERDLSHLHEGLLLGLDTVEKRRVRELELVVLSGLELVVGLGLWNHPDKVFEVTWVSLNLEPVQVDDVGNGSVEEVRVVGDDDGGTVGEGSEVVESQVTLTTSK
jgi:hypothetical protein